MAFRESQNPEREMSTVEAAGGYVRRMVETEARGWGDQAQAQQRLEAKYGLPFWALEHLRTGRAKTVEAGLFARIMAAYLDLCERQVGKLLKEIAIEKAINEDDDIQHLERQAARLVAEIQARKAKRLIRKAGAAQ